MIADIGSGNNPMQQADVIVDKYPHDDTHRRGKLKIPKGARFVKGDVTNLCMFRDREFDFVNCTHVIEHLDEPWLAMTELMRIGKSGYIEYPSFIAERLLFGSSNHKWAIITFWNNFYFYRSVRKVRSNHDTKFKMFRLIDFLLNTVHTKTYWGRGKIIKYRLSNQSTTSRLRKLENFLSFTIGIVAQDIINAIIFFTIKKREITT